jgi:hypothetical protein
MRLSLNLSSVDCFLRVIFAGDLERSRTSCADTRSMTDVAAETNLTQRVAGVLAKVVIGIAFFFAIIGVFGLWVAIAGLALAILTAGVIIGRVPEDGDPL